MEVSFREEKRKGVVSGVIESEHTCSDVPSRHGVSKSSSGSSRMSWLKNQLEERTYSRANFLSEL